MSPFISRGFRGPTAQQSHDPAPEPPMGTGDEHDHDQIATRSWGGSLHASGLGSTRRLRQ